MDSGTDDAREDAASTSTAAACPEALRLEEKAFWGLKIFVGLNSALCRHREDSREAIRSVVRCTGVRKLEN